MTDEQLDQSTKLKLALLEIYQEEERVREISNRLAFRKEQMLAQLRAIAPKEKSV